MKQKILISLALAGVTLLLFWRITHHGFINFDDPGYVYQNAHVISGFSLANVSWAFTTFHMGNWHPLAWLSHMADCQLFGLDPGWHHFSSLLLHALNAVCLFLLLSRLTGSLWRSAFVASLFALHPLHVESVAWVAERKDLLAALFWLLTMYAYARYVERPGGGRYLLVVASFILGLMAKPMLVTLPFVLLLCDYWPLGRMAADRPGAQSLRKLAWEKWPLFALSALSSLVTVYAQQHGGAVSSLGSVPLGVRIANALTSWVWYLGKMLWPAHLSIIYPLDRAMPLWPAALAGALLLGVTFLVLRRGRKYPYLPVGWLWYLGTLVPVIGLVQVGLQASADRYTYLPLIGPFVMIAWGVHDLLAKWRMPRQVPAVAAFLVLALLAAGTRQRLGDWRDSTTLFSQAIAVTGDNFYAHYSLGTTLAEEGMADRAIGEYQAALAINPRFAQAYYNLGNEYGQLNRLEQSADAYRRALALSPGNAQFQNNLGVALARMGRRGEAIEQFAAAVRSRGDYAEAHYNLGIALQEEGRSGEAARQFAETVRLQPGNADARRRLEEMPGRPNVAP